MTGGPAPSVPVDQQPAGPAVRSELPERAADSPCRPSGMYHCGSVPLVAPVTKGSGTPLLYRSFPSCNSEEKAKTVP